MRAIRQMVCVLATLVASTVASAQTPALEERKTDHDTITISLDVEIVCRYIKISLKYISRCVCGRDV